MNTDVPELTPSSKNTAPNVLVFFVDQQRWDTLGMNGYPAE